LHTLHERLRAAAECITDDYELIFVDDRSTDGSWDVLRELVYRHRGSRVFRLSRNFGQHAAITAGLSKATGRWIVVMDCDLEDLPEELPRLYAKALEGYDVVLTRRSNPRRPLVRRLLSRTYFRLRRAVMRLDVDPDYCTLSILSRRVVGAFLDIKDRYRQYMLILHWLGFERTVVDVEQGIRPAGKSSYTLRGLVRLALDGFFFETTVVLAWIISLGFALALMGGGLAVYFVVSYLTASNPPSGYTTLAVLILLVGGFIIISTGVTGLYIGKIFDQVKKRPLFVVADSTVDHETAASS
jgi:dolichol-phosphate mannosyltransferase